MNTTHCIPSPPSIKKPRVLWIDLFRVLAILITLAMHAGAWYTCIQTFFTAVVFFFFFISALFMKNIDWTSNIKRAISIAIPFFVWCVLSFFIDWRPGAPPAPNWLDLSELLPALGLYLEFGSRLWFLRAMILLILLNPILSRLNLPLLLIALATFVAGAVYTWYDPTKISVCSNSDLCLFSWGGFAFTFGLICRKYVGISRFLALCDRYAYCLLLLIAGLFVAERAIILKFNGLSVISTYMTTMFSLPVLCLVLSKWFPSLVAKLIILSPAMFFVYASQDFYLSCTMYTQELLTQAGHPEAAKVFLELSAFPMLALVFSREAIC